MFRTPPSCRQFSSTAPWPPASQKRLAIPSSQSHEDHATDKTRKVHSRCCYRYDLSINNHYTAFDCWPFKASLWLVLAATPPRGGKAFGRLRVLSPTFARQNEPSTRLAMLRLCRARGSAPLHGRLRRRFDGSRAASRVIPLPATAPTAAKPRLLIGRHRGRMNGFINQGVRKMIIGLLNQNDQNALVGNLPSLNLVRLEGPT